MRRIAKASLFAERLPTFFLNEDLFMSTVDVNPPKTLIPSADEALGLDGDLISYVNRSPLISIQKTKLMAADEQRAFFGKISVSPQWETYSASTPTGIRYSVLVEFDMAEVAEFSAPQQQAPPDPDNPRWGPLTGIGVWLVSVAAIIAVPIIAVIIWYIIQSARGAQLPNLASREELIEWLKSPNLLLVQVLSTIVAHAITIAICWVIVTKLGKRPFWQSLGWRWAGHSVWYWIAFSACVIVALLGVTQVLSRFLPEAQDNSFAELLKSSQQVRIAVAVLATFTAPLVEETVYRGVLFSSLRRYLGLIATVALVTLMFVGVHVVQYWGAWVSIAGLTLLSFLLTVVRARTKSILPCVLIHTVNNAFFSVLILMNKAS